MNLPNALALKNKKYDDFFKLHLEVELPLLCSF